MGKDRPHFVMVTRQPTGQDLVCLVCHKQAQDVDHVVNRGSGGSKARDVPENKVPLCRECHTAKTNGVLETRLVNFGSAGWCYLWRRKGADASWISVPVEVSQRYKCLVLSAAAEEMTTNEEIATSIGTLDSAAALSAGLTHDQRVAIAAGIKEMEWGRQWLAGDTANEWEEELGEDFWNRYANEFGYTYPSLRNNQRVCAAIPQNIRNPILRFSHHVVVVQENREDMEVWLDRCAEMEWSVAEFRRKVKGERPRVKRWTLEELAGYVDGYPDYDARPTIRGFLDWLGEQDASPL